MELHNSAGTGPPTPAPAPLAGPRSRLPAWLAVWPAPFRMVLLYTFVSMVGWTAFDGFLTPFLRASGVPVVTIGVFFGLSNAVGAPGAAIGGLIADRWGRRTALLLGGGFRALGWLLILVRPGTSYLMVVAALVGMGWASSSAFMAIIAETAPANRRASAYAASMIVENVIAMLVPLATGLLADRFGLRFALSCALLPAALTLLTIRLLPETAAFRRTKAGDGAPGQAAAVDGDVAGTGAAGETPAKPAGTAAPKLTAGLAFVVSPAGRGAALMGAIWLVTGFQMGLMGPVRPLYITDRFGVSYAGLGLLTMLGSLGMVLGTYLGGRVADRMGQSRLMIICLAFSGFMYMLVPVAATAQGYAAIVVVANFAAYSAAPCWGAVGASSAPRQVRGSVTGLYIALRGVGGAAGGLLSGVIYSRAIALPFYVTAGTEWAMLALVLLGARMAWSGFGKGIVHE